MVFTAYRGESHIIYYVVAEVTTIIENLPIKCTDFFAIDLYGRREGRSQDDTLFEGIFINSTNELNEQNL